jgi:hypothetical protein
MARPGRDYTTEARAWSAEPLLRQGLESLERRAIARVVLTSPMAVRVPERVVVKYRC